MKKIISLTIVIGCVLFLIFSPSYISSGLGKSIYEIREQAKEDRFEGHISLWHVVSFKTPYSSGYSLITTRMRAMEKLMPYTYIDISAMTPSEAARRLKAGEKPDVISYPWGFIGKEGMLELEEKKVAPTFNVESNVAYPYMADSYVLAVNSDMLFNLSITPNAGDMMEKDVFLSVMEDAKAALTFSDVYGLDKKRVLDSLMFGDDSLTLEQRSKLELTDGGMTLFLEEGCAMIICPYSEYIRTMESKKAPNFSVQCYDISGETDLIQLVSAFRSEDAAKDEALRRICASFLATSCQKKVAELGMFPVVEWQPEKISRFGAYKLIT